MNAGDHPGSERGFTLVELMVVVMILALASTAVLLTMPDGRGKVREDAERFAARVSAARDDAILQSRPMSVWVSPSAYGFARRVGGGWQGIEDRPFATTPWRYGVVALTGAEPVRIAFDGTGMTEQPAEITLIREGARVPVTVGIDGKVTVGA